MGIPTDAGLLRSGNLIERRDQLLAERMDAKIHLAIIECELKQIERFRQLELQREFAGNIEECNARLDAMLAQWEAGE